MTQFDITIQGTLKEQFSEAEQITIQVLHNGIFEMIQQELRKHINTNATVSSVVLSNTSMKTIKTGDLVPAMLIKGTDTATKKVPMVLLCKQALMRRCINLIMGLDNNASAEIKFDEFDLSAANEMMNGLFQQSAIKLSEVAGRNISSLQPSVGLFKNFGDFLQTLRLTSDAPVTQVHFSLAIGDEEPSPCLAIIDFKAFKKWITDVGPLAMETAAEPSMPEPATKEPVITQPAAEPVPAATAKTPEQASSNGGVMSQDAIEAMLAKRQSASAAPQPQPKPAPSPAASPAVDLPKPSPDSGGVMSQEAIEAMLAKRNAANAAPQSKPAPQPAPAPVRQMEPMKQPAPSPQIQQPSEPEYAEQTFFSVPMIKNNMDLVMNVPLTISVVIGNTKKKVKEILDFQPGTVIELEKQHNSPMDVIVNGELFARGEVVVIEENFGVRLTELCSKSQGNS